MAKSRPLKNTTDFYQEIKLIACMIYDHFQETCAHDAALDLSDLFTVSLQGDDIQDFNTRWDQALLSANEIPQNMSWRVCTS